MARRVLFLGCVHQLRKCHDKEKAIYDKLMASKTLEVDKWEGIAWGNICELSMESGVDHLDKLTKLFREEEAIPTNFIQYEKYSKSQRDVLDLEISEHEKKFRARVD